MLTSKPSNSNKNRLLTVSEVATMFGVPESQVRGRMVDMFPGQQYLSIQELAVRWRCSRGTVYNRLRAAKAKVLDFAPLGKKGRKVVSVDIVDAIEAGRMKRLA